MLPSDNHVHSEFSSDSDASLASMAGRAVALGLLSLCFTDHIDYGFPAEKYQMDFLFSPEEYFAAIKKLSGLYPGLSVRTGVELGLKDGILCQVNGLTEKYPFDFVIGSTHLVDNMDPYYAEYWDACGEMAGIRKYYETTYHHIVSGFDFDVYGHIDYVIRYCPTIRKARQEGKADEAFYRKSIKANRELIDEILFALIDAGRGIEVNTGGFRYGLGHPNPHEMILCRYRALGGTLLSIGSDAHTPEDLGYSFAKLPSVLRQCGFTSYTEFRGRKPVLLSF